MSAGSKIKELREKIGLTQVQLADKIDVSKQTLYKYENDIITNIPSDKIEAIAKICGVTPSYSRHGCGKGLRSARCMPSR